MNGAERPKDWETRYSVEVAGKTLEAIKYLAAWALKQELRPIPVIAAADCAHCFQRDVRGPELGNAE